MRKKLTKKHLGKEGSERAGKLILDDADKPRHHELLDDLMSGVLRSMSMTIALVYPALMLYDYVEWSDYPTQAGAP